MHDKIITDSFLKHHSILTSLSFADYQYTVAKKSKHSDVRIRITLLSVQKFLFQIPHQLAGGLKWPFYSSDFNPDEYHILSVNEKVLVLCEI